MKALVLKKLQVQAGLLLLPPGRRRQARGGSDAVRRSDWVCTRTAFLRTACRTPRWAPSITAKGNEEGGAHQSQHVAAGREFGIAQHALRGRAGTSTSVQPASAGARAQKDSARTLAMITGPAGIQPVLALRDDEEAVTLAR